MRLLLAQRTFIDSHEIIVILGLMLTAIVAAVLAVGIMRIFIKPKPPISDEEEIQRKQNEERKWTEMAITLSLAGIGYFIFFFDTTVEVPAKSGTYIEGVGRVGATPRMRVHNLDRANTQRNWIIFCSVCAVVNGLRLLALKRSE